MSGPNSSLLRGKSGVGDCLSVEWHYLSEVEFMEKMSYFSLISDWVFSYPVCRGHSASCWITFRETCSMCSCMFGGSVGGRKLRRVLC